MEGSGGKLKLPDNYWSERANKPNAAKKVPSSPKSKEPLLRPTRKRIIILIFLCLMYVSSSATWFSMVAIKRGVNNAMHSMSDLFTLRTFSQLQEQLASPPQPTDRSAMQIITHPNLRALITYPDGSRVGEDGLGNVYNEADNARRSETNVIIEQERAQFTQRIHEIETSISKPQTGSYTVTFTPIVPGHYYYSLKLVDKSGDNTRTFKNTISFDDENSINYQLFYQKDNIQDARFPENEDILRKIQHLFAR